MLKERVGLPRVTIVLCRGNGYIQEYFRRRKTRKDPQEVRCSEGGVQMKITAQITTNTKRMPPRQSGEQSTLIHHREHQR